MPQPVTDINIMQTEPLPSPESVQNELPADVGLSNFVANNRREINDIIFGSDKRMLLVVGPCSIHDTQAGLEYAQRLKKLDNRVGDRIKIVMRAYFEKPRTTVGWKGLIMDPDLDGSCDIVAGLRQARGFLRDVLHIGLPTATELLDPITPQYIADLICWSAIGARTTESQTHRQMASGFSMALGFKNSTDGSIMTAINAIKAARVPQRFFGVSREGRASILTTRGNPHCHIVLRGGKHGPNFDEAHICDAENLLRENRILPAILIDCCHDNSGKDPDRAAEILLNTIDVVLKGHTSVIGWMLESNLKAGAQKFPRPRAELEYGVSITDPCMGWESTEKLVLEVYERLAPRFANC